MFLIVLFSGLGLSLSLSTLPSARVFEIYYNYTGQNSQENVSASSGTTNTNNCNCNDNPHGGVIEIAATEVSMAVFVAAGTVDAASWGALGGPLGAAIGAVAGASFAYL